MELNKLLNELNADNSGHISNNIDSRMKRIETLTTGEFVGKVHNVAEFRTLLSSMKDRDEDWKKILYGVTSKSKESPKANATNIERIASKLSPDQLYDAIPENNPDGEELNADQKKIYTFIDDVEDRLQRIAIGDFDSLFRAKTKKPLLGKDEEEDDYYSDTDTPEELSKKKASNIIPVKVKAFNDEYYGVIRPGSNGGSNGIVTWEKAADSFSTKMDHYDEKYDSLSDEQKSEYNFMLKNLNNLKKLPRTIPLIQRNSSGTGLKVHETQEVKALKKNGTFEYKDSPEDLRKVGEAIVNVIKDSGKSFAGQETKNLSKEQIAHYLGLSDSAEDDNRNYEIPMWVFNSSGFWDEIERLF